MSRNKEQRTQTQWSHGAPPKAAPLCSLFLLISLYIMNIYGCSLCIPYIFHIYSLYNSLLWGVKNIFYFCNHNPETAKMLCWNKKHILFSFRCYCPEIKRACGPAPRRLVLGFLWRINSGKALNEKALFHEKGPKYPTC